MTSIDLIDPSKPTASLTRNGTPVGPTAAVERGFSYSLQACSLSLQGWRLIDLPLRASFSPATHWLLFHPPALSLPRQPLRPWTCHEPGKGLPRPRVERAQKIIRIHPASVPGTKGRQGCRSAPFIVRLLRARRIVAALDLPANAMYTCFSMLHEKK
jgi:hypothetical protein